MSHTNREVVVKPATGGTAERIAAAIDRLVAWLARHWLAVFNLIVAVFLFLPFLAPTLMRLGEGGCGACAALGRAIYTVYRPTCHQLPERSFFLFGASAVYSTEDLEAAGAIPSGLNILQRERLRFHGSEELGWKVAICERDVAIYGGILVAGLAFGLVRPRWLRSGKPLPKMPFKLYIALLVPLAIDGATQLIGLRESNWWLRLITGGLFGAATVWLAYPHVQDAMDDIVRTGPGRRPNTPGRQTGQGEPSEV